MQNSKLVVRWSDQAAAVLDPAVVTHVDKLLERFKAEKAAGVSHSEELCAQETIVDEIRLRIRRGEVSHEDVVFEFENQLLQPNHAGRLPSFPPGFCDLHGRQLAGLVRPLPKT